MATTAAVLDILVKAETMKASAELKKFDRELSRTAKSARSTDRSLLSTEKRTTSFGGALGGANRQMTFFRNGMSLIKWPALIAGAGGAAQGLSALGAGATALTGALAPLSGALVAFPALFGSLGQAAGVATLAFSGVGDALGALQDAQTKAGASSQDLASKQRAAAESVRSAETALAGAQRGVTVAQEQLTQARVDAARQLEDMRRASIDAALGERGAALALEHARNDLRAARVDPKTTRLELRDLIYNVRVAEDALSDARVESTRSQDDLNRAERAGVQGSEQVVSARRALADANRQVAEANHDLADAQREATEAMADGGAAATTLQEKLSELPPATRAFAQYLYQLKPRLDALREAAGEGLFPGLQRGIEAANQNFPVLQRLVAGTAQKMGQLSQKAGELFGREGFGRDFERIGDSNIRLMGDMGEASFHFGDALRHVMVAARPLLKWMGDSLVAFSKFIEGEAKAGREAGTLNKFFEQTRNIIERLVSIGSSLAGVFMDIGQAAAPLGRDILRSLDLGAQSLERWSSSLAGGNALRQYFEDAKAPLYEMGRLIADATKGFFELSNTPGLTNLIRKVRTELLPVMIEMTKATTKAFGPVLVDFLVQFGKLLANLMGSSGALTFFVKGLTEAAKLLNNLFGSIPGLASAASSALAGFSILKLMGLTGSKGAGAPGLLSRLGTSLGTRYGTSFGNAAGPIAAGIIGSALAGVQFAKSDFAKENLSNVSDFSDMMAEEFDITLKKAQKVENWMRAHPGLGFPESMEAMERARRAKLVPTIAKLENDIRDLGDSSGKTWKEISAEVDRNMAKVQNSLGVHSANGKRLIERNFNAAVQAIKGAMAEGLISVEKGQRLIDNILRKKLRQYGIKDSDKWLQTQRELPGNPQGAQRGAVIVPGYGSGDKVPAMLEPGEVVINRKAVAAMGGANKANLVNDLIPRFASGGIVALGNQLLGQGYEVGEHPAFGGVSPVHASGSYHYSGQAIDVNDNMVPFASGSGEPGSLDRLYSRLKGMSGVIELLWRVAGHFDHLHVAMAKGATGALGAVGGNVNLKLPRFGSDFALGALVAGGLNNSATAIEKVFGDRISHHTGAEAGKVSGGSFSVADMAALWSQQRGPRSQAHTAGAVGMAESGGNPLAHNASGASGLWQILGQVVPGNIFDPIINAKNAVKKYTDAGGWSPWVAYTSGAYQQFLAEGGVVGSPDVLGKIRKQRTKTARLDEMIANAQIYASMMSSEAGAETGPGETAGLVGLNATLLKTLENRQGLLRSATAYFSPRTEIGKNLRTELAGIQGITGMGGRLLDVKSTLDSLGAAVFGTDDTAERLALTQQLLQESNLRYGVSQAQYGVLGGMQAGGVAPVVGNADVQIIQYTDGSMGVSVNGKEQSPKTIVRKGSRGMGRRPLPSSKGF